MLLFSEYDKSLDNIYSSQPVVDINLGDTNKYLVRFPKFKKVQRTVNTKIPLKLLISFLKLLSFIINNITISITA